MMSALRAWAARISAAAAAVAAAIALAMLARAYMPARRRAPERAARLWLEAERSLARIGFRRQPWQTPLEFARLTAAEAPYLGAAVELARAYYRLRYAGDGEADAARALDLLNAAAKIRHIAG